MDLQIYQNTCPRNCYGTCSILSYVENNRLVKVTGNKMNEFTKGKLCAKGYSYTDYVYNEQRLKYPIMQSPRRSGNWERISWDRAYSIIANKIIELNKRYNSNLAISYNKYSGNKGLLHYAVEGMFNSFGPHTKPVGSICALTGINATIDSFGELINEIPENMANSKSIVLWGANPAVTNVHQMKFIYDAKQKGAQLVVIDPIFSTTAQKADLYIQINPGTDGMLALGVAKVLLQRNTTLAVDQLHEFTKGAENFINIINSKITLAEVCNITGVNIEAIEELANIYDQFKPVATWNGIGIQRNKFGGENIKIINSLVALTGNLSLENGGVYYCNNDLEQFPLSLYNFPVKKDNNIENCRELNINNFPVEALELTNPPLKFLWVASRNTFTQDRNFNKWRQLLNKLELIVAVDLFMTPTALEADIVLPAASHFEEEDINVGYWHHYLSINEKAIPQFYESKSDLKIARELTAKLNELSPGFSTFPAELTPIDWIEKELSTNVKKSYGIDGLEDLLEGPKRKLKITNTPSRTNSFQFINKAELSYLINNIESHRNKQAGFQFQLLTPQSLLKIHSQFSAVSWLHPNEDRTTVQMNDKVASELNIKYGDVVNVFNENGSIKAFAEPTKFVSRNVVIVDRINTNSINQLIGNSSSKDENQSATFYDCFVSIKK